MYAERAEAFTHNSCKKVAQLVKVVTIMAEQARDSQMSLVRYTNHYEEAIHKLSDDYIDRLNEMGSQLSKYRKSVIDKMCRHFGNKYKDSKGDYTASVKNVAAQFSDIVANFKKLRKDCVKFETDVTISANEVTKSADDFFSDVKKQKSKRIMHNLLKTNPEMNEKLQQIQDSINESATKFRKMQEEQDIAMTLLNAQIKRVSPKELRKRFPEFQNYKKQLTELHKSVTELNKAYTSLKSASSAYTTKSKPIYKKIINEALTSETRRNSSKDEYIRKMNKEQKEHAKVIASLNKQNKQLNKTRAEELNAISKQIEAIRNQIEESYHQNEEQTKKKNEIDENLRQNQNDKNQAEQTLLKSKNLRNEHSIQLSLTKTEEIKKSMDNDINIIMKSRVEAKNAFHNNIINDLQVFAGYLSSEQHRFKDLLTNFDNSLKESFSSVDKLAEISIKTYNAEIENLMSLIKSIKAQNNKIQDQNIQENEAKVKDLIKTYDDRQKTKYDNYKQQLDHHIIIRNKKIDETKQGFSHDLEEKQTQLNAEFSNQLQQNSEQFEKEITNDKEVENHNFEILKYQTQLKNQEASVQYSKDTLEKTINNLDHEINQADKSLRAFQRSIKTQTSEIIEQFEMQITVDQVKLKDAIENISKLYSKEENQQGCDIIEAIRRVQQTKNRTDDLILKRTREYEEIKAKYEKAKIEIQNKISQLKSGAIEKEKIRQIAEQQVRAEVSIEDRIADSEEQIQKLKKEIENEKSKGEKQKSLILHTIETDKKMFEDCKKEIEDSISKIPDHLQPEKEIMIEKVNNKKNEITKNFNNEMTKLKQRKEFLENQQKEVIESNQVSISKLVKQNDDDSAKQQNEHNKIFTNMKSNFMKISDQFDKKVIELTSHYVEKLAESMDKMKRDVEDRDIYEAKAQSSQLSRDIEQEFNSFYGFLSNARKPVVEPKSPIQKNESERNISTGAPRRAATAHSTRPRSNRSRIPA
ncbi:hypothetical protein TVAG_231800 [Trichomonas vaginalis G3]|uniref:Uncharacterized protein n=1 Tax=Trichomonas vaginalis (strain ATCC PRA-98 / G3) TaxID=412133 RepID=A2G757_TRIV3|nr:biological adhesion protein [Trichomonas vaginalis G3]EAX87013.1 hypothetical protein TVAG_231800 [Trichomonas vaginalis G3]KAI5488760.1 biological adhesion protein [Trichomonas vaginalis G3]|eukprot:XP_001299943.1 hypothetical protein [Trichomonas vaginalis G3]